VVRGGDDCESEETFRGRSTGESWFKGEKWKANNLTGVIAGAGIEGSWWRTVRNGETGSLGGEKKFEFNVPSGA